MYFNFRIVKKCIYALKMQRLARHFVPRKFDIIESTPAKRYNQK